jgi:NDP-sugar pyrophosphorylase family protein
MGIIGEKVPKVLWPLFHHSILYYQLCYVEQIGIRKVFINAHHLSSQIYRYVHDISFCFSKLDIEVLQENEILDSGGGVHNCIQYVEEDYLLVINGDAFYFADSVNNIPNVQHSCLWSINVNVHDKYNRLLVENEKLRQIVSPSSTAPQITFSGVSLLYLPKIKKVSGPSRFFDTVANFTRDDIEVVHSDDYEYWDLGTKNLYSEFYCKYINRAEEVEQSHGVDFFRKSAVSAEVKDQIYIWKNDYLPYLISYRNYLFTSNPLLSSRKKVTEGFIIIGENSDSLLL